MLPIHISTPEPRPNRRGLEITEVAVNSIEHDDGETTRVVMYGRVTFNGLFVVTGVKVLRCSRGLLVIMPSKQLKTGHHVDVAFPISDEGRRMIEVAVLQAYGEALARYGIPQREEQRALVS